MCVSLYTTRIILEALGITDYGIYNIVGGIVSLLSIVTSSQAGAINRFITFAIGEKDERGARITFSAGIVVQLFLGVVVLVMGESIGVYVVNYHLDIPVERLFSANIVFQLSLITFVVNMISVPYNAAIIATERMSIFALIGLFEGVALLASALIVKISGFDKLITYGILVFFVALIVRMFYVQFCHRNISFCNYEKVDRHVCLQILKFGGWNMIGVMSGILKEQGLALLFNLFFGPVLNAAKGISMQVGTAITKFSENFLMAVRPRVIKAVAANTVSYRNNLVCLSSKYAYFLLLLISFPLLVNASSVMSFWLKTVPSYSIGLTQICIVQALIDVISIPVLMLILAQGNIKKYQIYLGGVQILNLPLALILILLYRNPMAAMYGSCLISVICVILRILMARKLVNFPVIEYFKTALFKCVLVTIACSILQFFIYEHASFINMPLVYRLCLSGGCVVISILLLGIGLKEWKLGISYLKNS